MGKSIGDVKEIERLQGLIELKSVDKRYARRIQVVLWSLQGHSQKDIAGLSGYSLRGIYNILKKYREGGVEAVGSHYVGTNRAKLTHEEEKEALDRCLDTAKKGSYVRVNELKKRFEELTGISYHLHVFYRLLKRNGWAVIEPRGRHPKSADEASVEDAKKLTLLSEN